MSAAPHKAPPEDMPRTGSGTGPTGTDPGQKRGSRLSPGIAAALCVSPAAGIVVFAAALIMGAGTRPVLTAAVLGTVAAAAAAASAFASEALVRRSYGKHMAEVRDMTVRICDGDLTQRLYLPKSSPLYGVSQALNSLAASLAAAEESRSTFISGISHDMRTPMTSVVGFIDCILGGAVSRETEERYLTMIKSEVLRLSRLVRVMLDISRLNSDTKPDLSDFDICETVRQILISLERRIDEKHLSVSDDFESSRMFVLADEDAIYQVLYNLIDNAVKFSYENTDIRITLASCDGGSVRVTVFNEGVGIPAEDQPFVFDKFFKSDRSRGIDRTGFGLGLYICKLILDAHGRTMVLRSDPGRNCEFSFTLAAGKNPDRQRRSMRENDD